MSPAQRAIVYARQSLDRSGEGAAVDRQVEDCTRLAEARRWEVVEVITDNDVSASNGKLRPGYERLLTAMRAGSVEHVVVWHVDRLTRRLIDLEEVIGICEVTGVRLSTVTGDLDLSTDTGRMLARILASVARGEMERKGARQRRANVQRAEAGNMGWTRRPFGYDRVNGHVVVVPEEADGLRAVADMVLTGETLSAGARMLTDRGLLSSASLPWNIKTLRYVLLNPRYSGRVTYNGVDVAEGVWPPILDTQTQERIGEKLRDVKRRVQQGTEAKYLLSGIARCGRCGGVLFASPMGAKGQRWMVYRCRACRLARRLDLVDEVVEIDLLARLSLRDAATLFVEPEDVERLRQEASELRQRRDDLAGLLADGLLSAAVVREKSTELTARLAGLESRIGAALGDSPALTLASADDVVSAWELLGVRDRKAVVDTLMTVSVLPAGKGVRFNRDQVAIEWKTS